MHEPCITERVHHVKRAVLLLKLQLIALMTDTITVAVIIRTCMKVGALHVRGAATVGDTRPQSRCALHETVKGMAGT